MTPSTTDDAVEEQSENPGARYAWRNGRVGAGVLGLLITSVYLWESRGLAFGTLDAPGPGLFPLLIGLAFGLTSLGVVFEGIRNTEKKELELPTGKERRTLLIVIAAFVVFSLLLPVLGFSISAPLLLAFYMRVIGHKVWWKCAAFGIVTAVAVYVVFAVLIEVRLPQPMWS